MNIISKSQNSIGFVGDAGIGPNRPRAGEPAPIALFVYNRPDHTRQTLEHLRANHLAQQSRLFIFADGPKDKSAISQVLNVRNFIHSVGGFRTTTVIERDRNLGLSASIISGVTQLCGDFGQAIVVEDDVLTAPDFLTFLNRALDRYADEPTVFSVGGFNLPIRVPPAYAYDAFFTHRFFCWGWGTWRSRWEQSDWSVKDYAEFAADPERQKRFDRGGNDCSWLLSLHMAGKVDSWDTVWAYTHSKYGAVTLLPIISKVNNIGFDGSGTHCRRSPFVQTALTRESGSDHHFPDSLDVDPYFAAEIQRRCDRPRVKRIAQYVRDCFAFKRRGAARDTIQFAEGRIQRKQE